MASIRSVVRVLVATSIVCLLTACGGDDDPEKLLRQTINEIQQAAEQRQLSSVMEHVNSGYLDAAGYDRKKIKALLQIQFLRNPKIYTLKQVKSLVIENDLNASATIVVALAGRPIDSATALSGLRADLYRFDLKFTFDQTWQLSSAQWYPATASDFL